MAHRWAVLQIHRHKNILYWDIYCAIQTGGGIQTVSSAARWYAPGPPFRPAPWPGSHCRFLFPVLFRRVLHPATGFGKPLYRVAKWFVLLKWERHGLHRLLYQKQSPENNAGEHY